MIKKRSKIVIVDYGLGNTRSVGNALKVLGYRFLITREQKLIKQADALIIPGVGSFGEAMGNLGKFNLIELLNEHAQIKRKPVLGICLGMQIFADSSEEDLSHGGLSWIKGDVKKIVGVHQRVPHVGWNTINILNQVPLYADIKNKPHFYFDHSYHYVCDKKYHSSITNYGIPITAAIQRDNICGVQFHPEKSQTNGLRLFRSFMNYYELT